MTAIPRAALWLGLAGLVPFLWGVATLWVPALAGWGTRALGPRFVGPHVQLAYGTVILSFMAGALWGFAARASGQKMALGLVLSVLPALYAFAFVGGGPQRAGFHLIVGFTGILVIDALFWLQGLAPRWWMSLRLLLTAVVVACLLATVA